MMRLACSMLAFFAAVAGVALLSPSASAEGTRPLSRSHASITEGLDCATCHTTAGWKTLNNGPDEGGFDHSRTGFPLTGRHKQAACTTCHRAGEQVTRACSGCHADAHQRKLGQDCDSCHSSQTWQSVRAIERHRLTRLPLTGMHALADCTECHRRTTDAQWSSVPADCFACHEADYRRRDIHPLHTGGAGKPPSAPFSRNCTDCHRTTSWSPAFVVADAFNASVTGSALTRARAPERHEVLFPIARGSHRTATCEDCHSNQDVPQAVRCTGCHAHNAVRLRSVHRNTAAPLSNGSCLSCHPGGAAR